MYEENWKCDGNSNINIIDLFKLYGYFHLET